MKTCKHKRKSGNGWFNFEARIMTVVCDDCGMRFRQHMLAKEPPCAGAIPVGRNAIAGYAVPL